MQILFIGFGIICLVILAAAGLAWVLNLYGVIPLDPDQRKILNQAFGVSLLGGLGTAGAALFTLPKPDPAPGPRPTPTVAPTSTPTSTATPTPSASSSSPEPQPPTTPTPAPGSAACRPAAHPAFIADWASAALGTPPTFRCAIAAPYPECVAELREKPLVDITSEAASACGAQLLAFRQTHIGPAYAAKHGYQDNLDAAEASLRTPRSPEEQAWLSYVNTEVGRMNGPLWTDFIALDRRSRDDMLLCQSSASRCLPPG